LKTTQMYLDREGLLTSQVYEQRNCTMFKDVSLCLFQGYCGVVFRLVLGSTRVLGLLLYILSDVISIPLKRSSLATYLDIQRYLGCDSNHK